MGLDWIIKAKLVLTFDEKLGDLENGAILLKNGRIEAVLSQTN
jgi:cytosine/adenosine deaminase-related metal-dependent hydrolase